ncbi:MAG: hypothetical protein H7276_10745 [Caulobacter sp.]|nr:hypothetical protein [Vitreoscilla sp.]
MQISSEQWSQMGRDSFVRRMLVIIRRHHPEKSASLTDEALSAAIQRQFERALGYGLADEQAAATYIHSAWLLGQEFDERIPGIHQVLVDPALPAARKAAALDDFTRTVFTILSPPGRAQ